MPLCDSEAYKNRLEYSRKYSKEYYKKNRDKVLEYRQKIKEQYYKNNKDDIKPNIKGNSDDAYSNKLDCSNKCAKEYYQKNKERITEYVREKKYGINADEFNNLLEKQNGCCAICGKKYEKRLRFSVEHDHISGKIRGITCHKCNIGIGMFEENVYTLKSAIEYIEKNNGKS
jgi:hypothetical protein